MTKEELLKPRYKVIADYPCAMHYKGEIIPTYETAMSYSVKIDEVSEKVCLADYPGIFRKLEWWEEREKKDMPEYVKCIRSPDNIHISDSIYKVQWNMTWGYDNETNEPIIVSTNCYEPSTEEEYLSYINKNKQA